MLLKDVRNEVGHGIPNTFVCNGCFGLKGVRILFDNNGFPQLVKLHLFVLVCVRHVMTKHVHVMTHGCQWTMWGVSSFFPLGGYQDGNQITSLSSKGLCPLSHLPGPGLPQF